ncbi:MAG: response regulator [Deltaproteobacteria bacterium]|nr:response regulator [Deltaproteobacteria bacterium]
MPHVLLVEDDEDLSRAMMARLGKREYTVTRGATAEEALTLLEHSKTPFDAVVTDLKLPGIDGIAFVKKVRETHANIPIIVITGYASLESAREALQLEVSDYLLKPLNVIEELIDPLEKAIRTYHLERDNEALMKKLKHKVGELEHANSTLRLQGKIFELIALNSDISLILETLGTLIEQLSHGGITSFILISDDGELFPEPQRASGGRWDSEAQLRTLIRIADIEPDPHWQSFVRAAQHHNITACWAWPRPSPDGKLMAAHAMALTTKEEPSSFHQELVAVAARLTALAMERKQSEGREQQAAITRERAVWEHDLAEQLERTNQALKEKAGDLEKFHKLTIDREWEILKLKKEMNALLKKHGEKKRYSSQSKGKAKPKEAPQELGDVQTPDPDSTGNSLE